MPPIRLSDFEIDAVLIAARPIAVERRDAFLQHVADELSRCEIVGPGTVHRVCLEAQREFFDPPDFSSAGGRRG